MRGTLVLVVGPSGAGKDTLIAAARKALAGDPLFVFVRRMVTRDAIADLEDHDTISWAEFNASRQSGACGLAWEAHGLGYALPGSIRDDLDAGKVVVANVSRHVVAEAVQRFARCVVIAVAANAKVRAARLAGRGREDAIEVAARLSRQVEDQWAGAHAVTVDNSGDLATSTAAFIAALSRAAGK